MSVLRDVNNLETFDGVGREKLLVDESVEDFFWKDTELEEFENYFCVPAASCYNHERLGC